MYESMYERCVNRIADAEEVKAMQLETLRIVPGYVRRAIIERSGVPQSQCEVGCRDKSGTFRPEKYFEIKRSIEFDVRIEFPVKSERAWEFYVKCSASIDENSFAVFVQGTRVMVPIRTVPEWTDFVGVVDPLEKFVETQFEQKLASI